MNDILTMFTIMQLRNFCCDFVQLELLVRDTKGQKKQAMTEAFLLNRQENCVGYIGPAFSGPAIEVSNFLSLDPINRAMISYVATSPQLSDAQFSNFLRTPPSDVIHAKLMATLMKGSVALLCPLSPMQYVCIAMMRESA